MAAAEEQERAYLKQEEATNNHSSSSSATDNPSILGRAVATEYYKKGAYGSIPSTQRNNKTIMNNANEITDSDLTHPPYMPFKSVVKCETNTILTTNSSTLIASFLDHIPGSAWGIGQLPVVYCQA